MSDLIWTNNSRLIVKETVMTNEKSRAIVFGAGKGAKALTAEINNLNYPVEIIAYADNNPKLQGTSFFDKPVIHPEKITCYSYDKIIIGVIGAGVMDVFSIIDQLVNNYGINPKIIDTSFFELRNKIKHARITALKNVAKLIYGNNVVGSTAELGVYKGDFAKHINEIFYDRQLYLFDTFEGFSDEDIKKEKEIGTNEIDYDDLRNFGETSVELVMGKMKNPKNCIIRKGYFPKTVEGLEEKYAFVSLDADLYRPMLEGLKYFYPRLVKGGYIFVHDFFTCTFTGTEKAVMEYKNESGMEIAPMGDDCSIIITKG
jgi:O-methyltransferase